MIKVWMRLRRQLEFAFPLAIAIFAATLALNDLFSGKYGSDEIKLSNARNNSYQWYQSKGIKSTIIEGQVDLLDSLMRAGAIETSRRDAIDELMRQMNAKVVRYEQEKHEILHGSRQLPPMQWIQELDGQLGNVTGGKEYDSFLETLGRAASYFDLATMLFQTCLVFGAIGIIINRPSLKWAFFNLTLFIGMSGALLSIQGLLVAKAVENLY